MDRTWQETATPASGTGGESHFEACRWIAAAPLTEGQDGPARLTALDLGLRRAARAYLAMTGEHLPVYRQIALVHAAIHCDVPLEASDRDSSGSGVEVLHLSPDAPGDTVEVDLSRGFATLVVVRIREDFFCEARMIARRALPRDGTGRCRIRWHALPHRL